MAKCAYCRSRKGKRACPVLSSICSACCGAHRGGEIACPSDCRHLPIPAEAEAEAMYPALRKLEAFNLEEGERRWGQAAVDALLVEDRDVESWEQALVFAWVGYGYRNQSGERALDRFLAQRGNSLEPAERRALEALRQARGSLFRLKEVRPGIGVRVVDLLHGGEIFVHERRLTRDVEAGDHLIAWVVDLGGRTVFTAAAHVHPGAAPVLLDAARATTSPDATAFALHHAYRRGRRAPLTAHLGPVANSILFARSEYETRDRKKVLARLSAHEAFGRPEENLFLIPGGGGIAPCAAWILVRRVGLTLVAFTREDHEAAKQVLEDVLGPLARHLFDRVEEAGSLTVPEMEARIESLLATARGEEETAGERADAGGPLPLSRLPRDELLEAVEGLWPAVEGAAAEIRGRLAPGEIPGAVAGEEILDLEAVRAFLERTMWTRSVERRPQEYILAETRNLCSALHWLVNHELQRRKLFRVDEDLSFVLAQTSLDIEGEELRLPFPCAAFLFTDRETLAIAEDLLAAEGTGIVAGRRLRSLYAVAVQGPPAEEAEGVDPAHPLHVWFLFSTGGPGEPYSLQRDVYVRPKDHLEAILESRFPDAERSEATAVFYLPEMKKLLHLLLNAILYATSADVVTIRLPPRKRKGRSGGEKGRPQKAPSDEVFYLPGRIPISKVRRLRELGATESGRQLMIRFLVRGHWRRPNPNWKDRRLRWIEPYWKGPDLATVVEREYRLKS